MPPSDRDLAQQHSEELVELVAEATRRHHIESGATDAMGNNPCACGQWWDSDQGPDWDEHMAEVTLAALSSAGRLVPEGSKVREEFVVEGVDEDDGPWISYPQSMKQAEHALASFGGRIGVRRIITTPPTPWTPAEPAQRSGVAAQEKP